MASQQKCWALWSRSVLRFTQPSSSCVGLCSSQPVQGRIQVLSCPVCWELEESRLYRGLKFYTLMSPKQDEEDESLLHCFNYWCRLHAGVTKEQTTETSSFHKCNQVVETSLSLYSMRLTFPHIMWLCGSVWVTRQLELLLYFSSNINNTCRWIS